MLFAFELSWRLGPFCVLEEVLLAEEFAPEVLLAPLDELPPAEPPAPPAVWAFTCANDMTAPAMPTMTNRAR